MASKIHLLRKPQTQGSYIKYIRSLLRLNLISSFKSYYPHTYILILCVVRHN